MRLAPSGRTYANLDDAQKIAILKYLNLCSEELHLFENGLLPKATWAIWETEIVATLRSAPFRDAWKESHPSFCRLVEGTLRTN